MRVKQAQLSGFSLIEILVALGLFAFVSTASTAGLLTLIHANAKSQTLMLAMDNLSFVMNNLSRNIRTGNAYYCEEKGSVFSNKPTVGLTDNKDCTNGIALSFTDVEKQERVYYKLATTNGQGKIERFKKVNNQKNWILITADNINITKLQFTVRGSDPSRRGNTKQPTVTIWIEGEAGEFAGTKSDFQIQTTVTQRILDI